MKERLEFEIKILSSVQDQKRKKGQRLEFKTKKNVLSSRTIKNVLNGNVLSARPKLERNLDYITGTRMYNQLLKLIIERREQKKIFEEKESLKESIV